MLRTLAVSEYFCLFFIEEHNHQPRGPKIILLLHAQRPRFILLWTPNPQLTRSTVILRPRLTSLSPSLLSSQISCKMNISTVLLVLALYLRVSAFVPAVKKLRATNLNYNIVMPPQDDETENEESFFARKKKEKAEEESLFRERCEGEGLNLSEIDRVETVDMYNNPMGSLIPGVHLTSMCGDD